jgi:hypothetical protein
VSPLSCAGAINTASTSAVATDKGHTDVISGQPSSKDHVGEAGLPTDRLILSTTLASTLSPVPPSVRTALIDPNWCRAMKEEFTALITNNT